MVRLAPLPGVGLRAYGNIADSLARSLIMRRSRMGGAWVLRAVRRPSGRVPEKFEIARSRSLVQVLWRATIRKCLRLVAGDSETVFLWLADDSETVFREVAGDSGSGIREWPNRNGITGPDDTSRVFMHGTFDCVAGAFPDMGVRLTGGPPVGEWSARFRVYAVRISIERKPKTPPSDLALRLAVTMTSKSMTAWSLKTISRPPVIVMSKPPSIFS